MAEREPMDSHLCQPLFLSSLTYNAIHSLYLCCHPLKPISLIFFTKYQLITVERLLHLLFYHSLVFPCKSRKLEPITDYNRLLSVTSQLSAFLDTVLLIIE